MDGPPFIDAIAAAMLVEWGQAPSALKEIGRITHTNERTVRNWVDGRNGPSGENLVALMRHSDEVLTTVLDLSGRHDLVPASSIMSLRPALVRAAVRSAHALCSTGERSSNPSCPRPKLVPAVETDVA